jgi:hypothetical protein
MNNNSGLCYKTTIQANLALAKIANYDCGIVNYDQTGSYLTIVIYDRKTFLVQAIGWMPVPNSGISYPFLLTMEQRIFCIFKDYRGHHRKGVAINNAT